MMPQATLHRRPGEDVIQVLKALCDDPANVVFLVSGRSKVPLNDWFADCDKLGIAAEHGYFYRWNKDADWEVLITGQVRQEKGRREMGTEALDTFGRFSMAAEQSGGQ